MAEIDDLREMTREFWAGKPVQCRKHPGTTVKGEFYGSNFADRVVLTCPRGEEYVIQQRPRQVEFNVPQIEGLILNIQRGDAIKCYRCQSNLVVEKEERPGEEPSRYAFTCVRCLSWGVWRESSEQQAS